MSAEESMFQEALSAIQQGQTARARDLLTRLLRINQSNPVYWLYMSTVVTTKKERVFCLKKVLDLDPQNPDARRNLAILGARPPDPDLEIPFAAQRRRWEARLSDAPPETKISRGARLQIILLSLAGLLVVALIIMAATGVLGIDFKPASRNPNQFRVFPTPVVTETPTPIIPTATPGPTAPWHALEVTYTATPVYAVTPHNLVEAYTIAMRSFSRADWDSSVTYFKQVLTLQPDAVDVLYLLGETYRMQGKDESALSTFNQAIKDKPEFAPPYLGRARLNLSSDEPDLETALEDLQTAADLDPQFGEVQLELANLHLLQNQPASALDALKEADRLLPGSPLVHFYRARALMQQENLNEALKSINSALSLDVTLLPAYLVRGELYTRLGKLDKALDDLYVYTTYAANGDPQTMIMLGEAWYAAGNVTAALRALDRAIDLDPDLVKAYVSRGAIYLAEKKYAEADMDYDKAVRLDRTSFEANAGMAQVWMAQEYYGDAYKRWEEIQKYAENDADWAILYYGRGVCLEKLNFPDLAIRDWLMLLDLPADAVPVNLRQAAQTALQAIYTPTPSRTPAKNTPTPTRTPARTTPTPTRTPRP